MCSGVRPTAIGDQLLTFGCVDHETVQCTYNANEEGGDYDASMAAFAACREASVGVDGYCRGELSAASGLSNQDACGGPNTNIAFHTLIPFVASCEGMYHFRFHADYGYGGFLGVDGVTHSAGDIWGHVFAEDVQLSEGDHYWEALGFEGCCDGHSELEVHLPNDQVADPWRPIISGASADLNGECEVVAPPPPPPPPPSPVLSYDFCFGAYSDDTDRHDFETGSAALPGGWTAVDDAPVSEAGNWYVVDNSGPALANDGWAAYEASNVWGNYPGDNALSGSYLINDEFYDQFIAEFEVYSADNDGLGFLFGFQDINDHFTATEINDIWPSPAADGYGGPHMKLRQRSGAQLPAMNAGNNVYSLLDSEDGDDGVSVAKQNFVPYTGSTVMNMALRVACCDGDGNTIITFLSSRHSSTGALEGVQRLTGKTSSYSPGKLGLFVYAHTATFDNFQVTPLSGGTGAALGYCEGAGTCNYADGTCACALEGATETMPDCSRGITAAGDVIYADGSTTAPGPPPPPPPPQTATIHVDDHVGAFVVGEPMTISFTDAGAGPLWDDWVGIYPVATCCSYEQLTNYVGGEWAYHGTADLGVGSVTVVPQQATDYYVLLLGGEDGYTELTDPVNRVRVTVIAAYATVSVADHVGDIVVGEPLTVTFTGAHSQGQGIAALWDDWVGIYPVATCCAYEQILNYVGGDGTGEWAYHGTIGNGASGSVTVVPQQATDYYVLLLGGPSGYLEITDPENRLQISVSTGGGGGGPPPPPGGHLWSGDYLTSDITFMSSSIDGYSTYRISVELGDAASNLYAIWGSVARPLNVPAAWQAATPFGRDIGGVPSAFFAASADSEFDSWLTIGATDGSLGVTLSAIGIDFDSWTESNALVSTDGSVFMMDPNTGPDGNIVLGQVTVPSANIAGTISFGLQGRSAGDEPDYQERVSFIVSAASAPPPAPPPAPVATIGNGHVTPVVTAIASAPGWATYTLSADLSNDARSLYSIFGRSTSPMSLPPAFQVATPFGRDIGGVPEAFVAAEPTAAYDSWLTVGVTDGVAGPISSIGIDWSSWTAESGITADNGAVFFMDPDAAPDGSTTLGQITVQAAATVTFGAQGRTTTGDNDWSEDNLSFDLPAPTTSPAPAPYVTCASRLSCDELGALYGGAWRTTTANFLRGSDQVCGESDTGFLGDDGDLCFGGQVAGGADTQLFAGDSWGHAGSICMAIGSRLCTVAELQAEETRGTGCEHDNEWVWAAEACDGGHMTAVGGNHNGQNRCTDTGECEAGQNPCTCDARCTPDTTHEAVRCCADVDPSIGETCLTVGYTTGCSALSCDELGALYGGAWRTTDANFLRGSDQVCGESDNGFNTDGTNLCFGGQVGGGADTFIDSWGHAASICMAIGSRLCTVAELQAEETRGTGCDHDNEWVWAAEACDGGHMTAVGGNHNGQNRCVDTGECEAGQNPCTCTARCTADATPEAVRCCADVAGQLCNAPPPSAPDVTVMSASAAGMTTVQLTFSLDASMANVYAMAGTDDEVMAFPAAFQVDAPFGTDIGGVPAAFIAVSADAAFDSWLTIGVTDGSAGATLAASPGLGLGDWSETAGISETNGAIFFMNPADGPAGDDIVLAQITSATPTGTASAKLQGRSADGSADWSAYKEWAW